MIVPPTALTVPKKQSAILTGKVSPRLSCLCIYELHLNICRHATSITSLGLHLILNRADLEIERKRGGRGKKKDSELQHFLASNIISSLGLVFKCSFITSKATLLLHEDTCTKGLLKFNFGMQRSGRDGRIGAEAKVFPLSQKNLADSGFH